MDFTPHRGEQRYAALIRASADAVVGLDFDGTLAPIVDDPAEAYIHPDAAGVLGALAEQVRAIAVITGRPARQVLDLGGLEEIAASVAAAGKDFYLFGQYGNERWSSAEPRIRSPRPPAGLAGFERDLPALLRRFDAEDAFVEEKGLAIAIHTRRLPDPQDAFERLAPEVAELARRHDLEVEPGHQVLEVRSGEMDKGIVVRELVERLGARGFLYAGDDLGDVPAFRALDELDREGLAALRVAIAAPDSALAVWADIRADGPDDVLAVLREVTQDAGNTRA